MSQTDLTESVRAMLRTMIKRTRWDDQKGYPGFRKGKFVHGSTLQADADEMAKLCAFAGVVPDEIIPLGECKDCEHAIDGRERGWKNPCVSCLRPRHDLFQLRKKPKR